MRLEELGVELESAELDRAFHRFKALADRKKQITDADLRALARDQVEPSKGRAPQPGPLGESSVGARYSLVEEPFDSDYTAGIP